MLFNSLFFIFAFLPLCLGCYFLAQRYNDNAARWVLLGFSAWFYAAWKIQDAFLLLGLVLFTFLMVARMRANPARRTFWLVLGLVGNVGVLFYFKYSDFAANAFTIITESPGEYTPKPLPLAISFYTFTQIAFLVDSWRDASIRSGLRDYGLYIVYFPHLVAGPILRHWELLHQLERPLPKPTAEGFRRGMAFFVLGLAKKVLIADTLAGYADPIFSSGVDPAGISWFETVFAAFAFGFQIYFDFAGYSDMAVGLARMLGFELPFNFDSPYKSRSIIEFWRRWHMTLSRWLKDYVYIPLGGSRAGSGSFRHLTNLMITMVVSGVWHGAGWTFLIWGACHGVFLIVNHMLRQMIPERVRAFRVMQFAGWAVTLVLVMWSWIYFRSPDVGRAWEMTKKFFLFEGISLPVVHQQMYGGLSSIPWISFVDSGLPPLGREQILCLAVTFLIVLFLPNTQQIVDVPENSRLAWLRRSPAGAVILAILFFIVFKTFFSVTSAQFIYFNF